MDKRLALELGTHAGDSAYDTLFRIAETAPPDTRHIVTLIALAYVQWKAQHAIKLMSEVDPALAETILALVKIFDLMPKKDSNNV